MDKYFVNQLFNCILDILFEENISYIQLSKILPKEEMINFFLLILNEFSENPNDIRQIFFNTNPKNNNLNMMFKENSEILLSEKKIESSEFMNVFINFINFALNSDDLSFLKICYNTCKQMILNSNLSNNALNNEKIQNIQKCVLELCFNCVSNFPYNISKITDLKYENKRQFIIRESFSLFDFYIKSKNKIHLFQLTRNNIMILLKSFSNNSFIKLMLLYHIFEQRNNQFIMINGNHQNKFNYDIYKESFYSHFDLLELYHDFFIVQKNINNELENILIILISQITKFFPNYNLFNSELINNIVAYSQQNKFNDFFDKTFFMKNIKIFDNFFFFKNPYKAIFIFINILMNSDKRVNLDSINYYDLDKLFKNFNDMMENELKEDNNKYNNITEIKNYMTSLFIKTCMIIFILFSSDLIIFAPIIESDSIKLDKNLYKFFIKLINTLFLFLKKYNKYINKESKDKLLSIMNEISMSNPKIYNFMLENCSLFNEELIHFLVDNIPHAITVFKLLIYLYKYDRPIDYELYLNGLIMFGYLVNKYPLRERYYNGLNILNNIQKVINLRELLKIGKNVDKFVLGIYLFYKAFPNSKNDTKGFINFLGKEIDYSFEKKTKDKIDNLCQFIKKEFFMNENYINKNTQFVDINDFVKNNFNIQNVAN